MRLIDADEMKNGIEFVIPNNKELLTASVIRGVMLGLVDRTKTVDATPVRRGHWEKITGMAPPEFHGHYTCSICGWCDKRLTTLRREMDYNFCPNCGADMRKE